MKTLKPKSISRWLAALATGLGFVLTPNLQAAFVYESPSEFFSAGDFNGDGIVDVLTLDKLTGNARVGYSDGTGNLTWSAPLVTGVQNVTGVGVEHFLTTTKDAIALTAPDFNHVNLVDLSQTNSVAVPQSFVPPGLGPHAVTGLRSPLVPPSGGLPYLLVASSFNDTPAERLDLGTSSGTPAYVGQYSESGPFERINGLDLNPGMATLAVGIVRGTTNDALHLWQFTNAPAVSAVFSNLASGSEYAFGNLGGGMLPQFIFYQTGSSNLLLVPLVQTNASYAFGSPLNIPLSEPVQQVYVLTNGNNSTALIQFGDGVQALTLSNGSPVLSGKYQAGAGAGNMFTGIVPLANGQFALLDAAPGASSTHAQVIGFNGTSFTQLSASNLPAISSRTSRANVWLFRLEPFVNRSPGFVMSLNSPDWADGVSGIPGSIQVMREADAGVTNGLGNVTTNNAGAAATGSAFGIPNQYNPAISLFSYNAPRAAEPIAVTISPPAGSYGRPLAISFTVTPALAAIRYRAGTGDSWHTYTGAFTLTNDATIAFYGTNANARSSLQMASYSLGNPPNSGTNQPLIIDPSNTNTPPTFSTNQLTISEDGTIFYGRVSAGGNYTIWAINLDGSSDTYITTGARPRLSRDGRYLAFLRGGSPLEIQGGIYVRDLKTSQETLFSGNSNFIIGYDWDNSSTNLIFDNSCGIYRESIGGQLGVRIPLPSFDCADDAPVVNPVTGSVAFHNLSQDPTVRGIYVTNPALNAKQHIVTNILGSTWPAWSPDGAWLSFVDQNNSSQNYAAEFGTNLWLVRADGTGLVQISGFRDGINGFPHGATWTPDGTALVAAGTIFGTNGLWYIPLNADYTGCDGPPILLPTSPGDRIDFAGSIVMANPPQIGSTQPPGLFIKQTAGAVIVYWSTNFAGYTLEAKTNATVDAWTPVGGPYFLAGGYIEYSEPRNTLSPQKFFRLHYTGATVTTQSPRLTIQIQSGSALISWPSTLAGFTLQYKTDLSTTASWTDLPGLYPMTGGNYQYTDSISGGRRRYYRLRGP